MQTAIDAALVGYVDRIEGLHIERDEKTADIKVVYGEVRDAGFQVGMVRQMVKERRMDPDARNAKYQLEEEYRCKLGMLADLPLGEAATRAEFGANVVRPRPFAEQPVHEPRRRGRPRKSKIDQHLDNARRHLGLDEKAAGSA